MPESRPSDSALAAEERRRNVESRDAWERFAPHRERVTRLIRTARPMASRPLSLALLGAGNLNDVDLPELLDAFATVHLFDLDDEAMRAGLERQVKSARAPFSTDAIHLHGGVDLSGALPRLDRLLTATPDESPALVDALIEEVLAAPSESSGDASTPGGAKSPCALAGGPFDVVVSLTLLSQILEMAHRAAGRAARYVVLVQALRRRHLQLLLDATAPEGAALLVFEVVSSKSCPELASTPLEQLSALLVEQIERQNFFTGLNPSTVAAAVVGDPRLRPSVAYLDFAPPWLWDLGPRTYAVTAMRMTRASGSAAPHKTASLQ